MKIMQIKKKSILKFGVIAVFLLTLTIFSTSLGMQHYYKLDFSTGLVTADVLNVRSGPGTNYSVVTKVKKYEYIRVFAGVGNWYIVQVEGDYVGAVSQQYVKPIYASGSTGGNTNNTAQGTTVQLTADEKEVFQLINEQRKANGLEAFVIDEEVQTVARIKAQDMVDNQYFSHTSPTYGSPFEMLNSFKISYQTAGENIAGNTSNAAAVKAWMNSPGHKANILNNSFNKTGVGVVSGSKYGKIYVQLFIGR